MFAADAGSDPKNLIVNYIPTPVTDDELRQLFEQFGEVESARIILDRTNNHPKGYGFVKFKTEEAAVAAIQKMNGFEIHQKRLKVTPARGPQALLMVQGGSKGLQNVQQQPAPQAVAPPPPPPPMMQTMVDPSGRPFNPMNPMMGGGMYGGYQMQPTPMMASQQQPFYVQQYPNMGGMGMPMPMMPMQQGGGLAPFVPMDANVAMQVQQAYQMGTLHGQQGVAGRQ